MIYEHHQKAIDYLSNKLKQNSDVKALFLSGSIAHGFNDENADIDINIVVSDEFYERKKKENTLTFWESAENFYKGGYFDGKYITFDYLSLVAKRGNEPSRFALYDSRILFDKTEQATDFIKQIGNFDNIPAQENSIRFLSQLEAWNWYCGEARKKDNLYLLDLSVSKLILFAGRLILLDNQMFFPYHKWFLRVLENAENKPDGLMQAIENLLHEKSDENISRLYNLVKNYKDWSGGASYSWSHNFLIDIETVWMRESEFVENL